MLATPTKSRLLRRSARAPRPGSPWAVVPLTGKQPNNGAETSVGECRLSLAFTGASHTWSHVLLRRVDGARVRYGRGSCVGWQHRGAAQRTALILDIPGAPGASPLMSVLQGEASDDRRPKTASIHRTDVVRSWRRCE